jgi:hypothetical protein
VRSFIISTVPQTFLLAQVRDSKMGEAWEKLEKIQNFRRKT